MHCNLQTTLFALQDTIFIILDYPGSVIRGASNRQIPDKPRSNRDPDRSGPE